jgi:hypothetical protein
VLGGVSALASDLAAALSLTLAICVLILDVLCVICNISFTVFYISIILSKPKHTLC